VQSLGYPNLLDDDWLWGGTMEDIHLTVTHGIRNTTDADARYSEMPKFGVDGLLDATQIGQVAEYVLQISGQEHDAAKAAAGPDDLRRQLRQPATWKTAAGDRAQGAPKLTMRSGFTAARARRSPRRSPTARFGVMPDWNERLSEDQIRAVAFYVHGLGGGE
jgi:cytochrome c oxidase cbb3-type subunit 3